MTCSFIIGIIQISSNSYAQNASFRLGIYDFTGMAASEIYIYAPTIQFGIPVWTNNRLSMEVMPGFSYNSRKYVENYHKLYMVPLLFNMNYKADNPGKNVFPVLSYGLSFLGKADHNNYMERTVRSFTYGFHASVGLHFINKNSREFSFNLTYNLCIPPVMEKINPSGVIIMFGYHFTGKNKE